MTLDKHAVQFFERQFRQQAAAGEYALNPFEQAALPHLTGEVLDLGCGLGNLALAAARQGCRVTALDGSPSAIARLQAEATAQGLDLTAQLADLAHYAIGRDYDAIVSIGLLMFLPEAQARALLDAIHDRVKPGGLVALNVLTEGTSYLAMFEPGHYYLFARGELARRFAAWEILLDRHERFPAPGATVKAFDTLIARRPAASGATGAGPA
ncbi:tellurite methyltransferase [Sulfuritortus calidifontis]|uniref:Tellurite methyltransferase n=1 Tax=Sulfuritortus calidifontis TaxID=1914471 RepID=A0A4R3JRK8_9PROT|nr:class I SAM-dependent methyltransferase [Sulfuritortus calidifontis]TCS68551.1 tellurite methyltransferase [Sulfuritortus calidifontis]